jgi:hypothetical protein
MVCTNGSQKPAACIFRSLKLLINDSEEWAAPIFSSLKVYAKGMCCPQLLQHPEGGFRRNILLPSSVPWRWVLKECVAPNFSSLKEGFKGMCCPQLQLPEGGFQKNVLLPTSVPWRWVSKECAAPNFISLKVGFEECATSIHNSLNVINNVPLLRWNPSTRLYGMLTQNITN